MNRAALDLVADLIKAIGTDERQHGGLLSRATLRIADEARWLVAAEQQRQGLSEPELPRIRREEADPL